MLGCPLHHHQRAVCRISAKLNLLLIWLLVASLLYVSLANSFQRDNPQQAIWLLVLGGAWPLIIIYVALGAILAIFLPKRWRA